MNKIKRTLQEFRNLYNTLEGEKIFSSGQSEIVTLTIMQLSLHLINLIDSECL